MRYLKYLLCLVILFPITVKGLVCDNTTKVRLQKLAQNITTSYDYKEQDKMVTFDITFSNLSDELYLVDTTNKREFYYSGDPLVLGGFQSGTNYKFEVRSTNSYCSGTVLYYLYVTTPYYNPYYADPICSGLTYKYCSKWQKNDFTYEEFIKNIEEYKKETFDNPEESEQIKGIFDYIVDFYISYYYIILPVIILIILIYIFINRKKDNLF